MNVTEDVIRDLMPVYSSGEAAADTRALVDAFLATHPAFAEGVRREWTEPFPSSGNAPHVAPSVELRSLRRTRRLLSRQRWLFAIALSLTLMPLSVEIRLGGGGVTGARFLMSGHLAIWLAMLGAAAICWLAYVTLGRSLRVSARRP